MSKRSVRTPVSLIERLEPRELLYKPAPIAKFGAPAFYFNDIQASATGGTGTSPSQYLVIRNAGTQTLTFNSQGLRIIGDDADEFVFTGKKAPASIAPGATRSIPIAFNATRTGIQTAILLAKSNDPRHPSGHIVLRGLTTAGVGGDLEPSLQQVLDLFQIPDQTGQANPNATNFTVPPALPSDDVNLQEMQKAGPGSVTITPLAAFVNQYSPATAVGWYRPGDPDTTATQLFTIPTAADAQSVHPSVSGNTSFDPGSAAFGVYTSYPAFSYRKSFSEDALNTWETKAANQRKIRFYPLKNPDGTVVPNAYVFAGEDYNQVYDFQDGVYIIRNVKLAEGVPTISIQNTDGVPGDDRMVFNRITNLDTVRPNVVHDKGILQIINPGETDLNIGSITLSDNTNFKIVSGGGSNITLGAGKSRNVTIQFVAAPKTGTEAAYSATLTVTSNDPDDASHTVALAGIWENTSEQTASHVYDEPSLTQIVNNTFGYKTVILKAGEKLNHGGHPQPVGEEVVSAYWNQADMAEPVTVHMLSAFHRQNNFDAVTDAAETAASTISYYYKGKPTQASRLFTHNINEGQSLLPHLTNSTTKAAVGSFRQSGTVAFGFDVDSHYTDDTLNALDFNPTDPNKTGIPGTGHAIRMFPLRDSTGKLVPNSYILAMDYTANQFSNWDYNDNVYLVTNIKPADPGAVVPTLSLAKNAATFSSTPVSTDKNTFADVLGSSSTTVL